jgi:peptidoglycan hydrolase CwlO-like protein
MDIRPKNLEAVRIIIRHPSPITIKQTRGPSLKYFRPFSKKRTFLTAQFYGFTLALVIAVNFATSGFANAQSGENYEKKLRELSDTIDEIQQQLLSTKTLKDELQQSLRVSEQEIGEYTKKIKAIKEALSREKKS